MTPGRARSGSYPVSQTLLASQRAGSAGCLIAGAEAQLAPRRLETGDCLATEAQLAPRRLETGDCLAAEVQPAPGRLDPGDCPVAGSGS